MSVGKRSKRAATIRPLLIVLLSSAMSALVVGSVSSVANAAETHANCVQFDDQGNITAVQPNCAQTVSMLGGQPQSQPSANPCTNPPDPGVLTMAIVHQVFHVNVNGAGDVWLSGTDSGTITFVGSATSGSGPYAEWFGASLNNKNVATTNTFNAAIHASGGETIGVHETQHFTLSASGVSVSFDKPIVTCGR